MMMGCWNGGFLKPQDIEQIMGVRCAKHPKVGSRKKGG
jgi:hypothetical protein